MTIVRLIFMLIFLSPGALNAAELLRIHGSNTVGAHLMPAMVKGWLEQEGYTLRDDRFRASNERLISASHSLKGNIEIEIQAHGSGTAFKGLDAGVAEIGMASRPIKDKERKALSVLGDLTLPGRENVVGLDGIAVVVHPSNPVQELSIPRLRQIFSGALTDWAELGGVPGPIRVYARDNKSGTYDTFKSLVIGKQAALVASARRYESNDQLSDDVAADPAGIGFTGLPSIRSAKALAVADGDNPAILPSELTVATEDYPLARRLFVYTPFVDSKPLVRSLTQFIHSREGQRLVAEVGFISQNIQPYKLALSEHYPEDYRDTLYGAERLSLNFRFRPGEYRLDNKALQDVDRLAEHLRSSPDKTVILTGFSDGAEEAPWRRYTLSTERGDYVAEQLIRRGVVPKVVRGFGSAVQVASNDTEKGRSKNRRVEVWIRSVR